MKQIGIIWEGITYCKIAEMFLNGKQGIETDRRIPERYHIQRPNTCKIEGPQSQSHTYYDRFSYKSIKNVIFGIQIILIGPKESWLSQTCLYSTPYNYN